MEDMAWTTEATWNSLTVEGARTVTCVHLPSLFEHLDNQAAPSAHLKTYTEWLLSCNGAAAMGYVRSATSCSAATAPSLR